MPWLIEACLVGAPPKTLGRQVSLQARVRDLPSMKWRLSNRTEECYKWLSKWMTLMGPYARFTLRRSGRVIVWSPPSVMTLGNVFPAFDGPFFSASVAGER